MRFDARRGGRQFRSGSAADRFGGGLGSAEPAGFADGHNTTAATDTALSDMLEEVDQAVSATADREVDTPGQGTLRAEVLQAANTVTGQIIRGREMVAGVGEQTDLTAVAAELGRAGTELLDLGDRLEAAG